MFALMENAWKFVLHWIMCVIGGAICGDFIIDVRQMRIPFLLRKALSCYLVFWIPSPCLGTGFSGSVFCSCLNFPSTFVYSLSTYVFCFFCVFVSVFSVVWLLMRVEWVGGCFMMFCVLFFCLFVFFLRWYGGIIVVYEHVYLLCFFLYIFLFCKGFSLYGIPFRKCTCRISPMKN